MKKQKRSVRQLLALFFVVLTIFMVVTPVLAIEVDSYYVKSRYISSNTDWGSQYPWPPYYYMQVAYLQNDGETWVEKGWVLVVSGEWAPFTKYNYQDLGDDYGRYDGNYYPIKVRGRIQSWVLYPLFWNTFTSPWHMYDPPLRGYWYYYSFDYVYTGSAKTTFGFCVLRSD
ncbi:MAG: hypothetical protein ACFFC7_16555 [Candidatus Hermodarchaeota archaeon]